MDAGLPELADAAREHPLATAHALPSPAELERVQAAGEAALFSGRLRPATRRAYTTALRYWDTWHRICYGSPLPLFLPTMVAPDNDGALRPPPVNPEVVRNFIVHHAPRKDGDRITTWMPPAVRAGLKAAGVLGQRRVACRRPVAEGDTPALNPDGLILDQDLPSIATLKQRVDLLCAAHRKLGLPSPAYLDPRIGELLAAARTAAADLVPAALTHKKSPLLAEHIQKMAAGCEDDPIGLRDRAMLLVAFTSGGRRRSELVAMDFEHLTPFTDPGTGLDGYLWGLPRTKTTERQDAGTAALTTIIASEAAAALDAWLDILRAQGITAGAVWRRVRPQTGTHAPQPKPRIGRRMSDREYVRDVIVARARIHLADIFDTLDLAGHSVRSGFVTEGRKRGMDDADLMAMTGHADLRAFRGYYQVDAPLDEAARVLAAMRGARKRM